MAKKVLVGGILAGLIIFFWSFVAHDLLPIGTMGVKTTANEEAVLTGLKSGLTEPGLYLMPGHELMAAIKGGDKAAVENAVKTYDAKYKGGPLVMVVYSPGRANSMPEPKMLVLEFLSDVVLGMVFAWAVSLAGANLTGFVPRILFVVVLGLLPIIATDFSNWNWYGFPADYVIGQALDQGIGALLAGAFLAWWTQRG